MRIKTIRRSWLTKMGACREAIQLWDSDNKAISNDSISVLQELIKRKRYDWASWLIIRVMTRDQYLKYAIYAAKQVLHLYEEKYPTDKRPRQAINAVLKCLKNGTPKNRAAAGAAWAAAGAAKAAWAAAEAAAWAAEAAEAAEAAAGAAWAAAEAAAGAAEAAEAAEAAARVEMQLKIIRYGIKILKQKCNIIK